MIENIKFICLNYWAGIVGLVTWSIGGFDLLVKALMMLMILDYISGLLVSGGR